MRVIKDPSSAMGARFTAETVAFMHNASASYAAAWSTWASAEAAGAPNITFFLSTGPIENTTLPLTQAAVAQANNEGLRAVWVDLQATCYAQPYHANGDFCDGCANHPGQFAHRRMFEAALPVVSAAMGWTPLADEEAPAAQWGTYTYY